MILRATYVRFAAGIMGKVRYVTVTRNPGKSFGGQGGVEPPTFRFSVGTSHLVLRPQKHSREVQQRQQPDTAEDGPLNPA
jgi:hypothetical protein